MASLWRALALSWLGGIASPTLTGDMLPGEAMRPIPVLARLAEMESGVELAEAYSREGEGTQARSRVGPPDDKQT